MGVRGRRDPATQPALRADLEAEPRARSAGTAWYALVDHEGHTHLAYVVVPRPGPDGPPRELNVRPQAELHRRGPIPDAPAPRGAGLPEHRRAQYPPALREPFSSRRFIPANPPELLDYPGAALVLIGAAEDASPAPDLIRREAPAGARGE